MVFIFQLKIIFTILSIYLISSQNVKIKIDPLLISIGKDLLISCSAFEENIDNSIGVFLKCPFNKDQSYCIKNCNSLDPCTKDSCNSKAIGNQKFVCYDNATLTNINYFYHFPAVSNSFLNYSQTVKFTCSFKGKPAFQQVSVIEVNTSESEAPKIVTSPTGKIPTPPNVSPHTRLIILLSLIGALFTSFLINVYCCVQWSIKHSKKKHERKNRLGDERHTQYPMPDLHSNHYSNDFSSNYNSQSSIKRTRSQPSMLSDERNNPTTSNHNNLNFSNTGSIKDRPKVSRPNTLALNDYDVNNGSRNSLLPPMYAPIMIAPIQYINPSMLPHIPQYQQTYINNAPFFVDNKMLTNLDRVMEQEVPERQNSSINQPLPLKPEDMISDKESVFS